MDLLVEGDGASTTTTSPEPAAHPVGPLREGAPDVPSPRPAAYGPGAAALVAGDVAGSDPGRPGPGRDAIPPRPARSSSRPGMVAYHQTMIPNEDHSAAGPNGLVEKGLRAAPR
ncbi:hypothetical protein GCM10010446_51610 [Streptomyces enissocaesilis]|uniref:Uncharacterized protein n=1 Tax=Streptomyces enissocaesilis TaxID=332589 RepID=A0ABN3XJ30_9ACTN